MNSSDTNLTEEDIKKLVEDNAGWAISIAKRIAQAWNVDCHSAGLDGAALEALLFCARRYDPTRGVPFRSYARRRIHEAATDEARATRGWLEGRKIPASRQTTEERATKISTRLLDVFPEISEGVLPFFEEGDMREAVRNMLISASILAADEAVTGNSPEAKADFKRIVEVMANLEVVHQLILWKVYWEGESLRSIAHQWEVDPLNVIREHKLIIDFLGRMFEELPRETSRRNIKKLKVRPGLRTVAYNLKDSQQEGPFTIILKDRFEE